MADLSNCIRDCVVYKASNMLLLTTPLQERFAELCSGVLTLLAWNVLLLSVSFLAQGSHL